MFNVDERPIPIVHRIIRVHQEDNRSVDVLTKVRICRHGPAACHFKSCLWSAVTPRSLPESCMQVEAAHALKACRLAQGDNNKADDRVLYAAGQKWLNHKHIMGRVVGCERHLLRNCRLVPQWA